MFDDDKINVLITCKTYPQPSISYREVVCTAGLSDTGQFIRLYPLNFRELPSDQQFSKYQWITVNARPKESDPRPESYKPNPRTIILGKKLPSSNYWQERRNVVTLAPVDTMCSLQRLKQSERSLGLVQPRKIIDLKAKEDDREWKDYHRAMLKQQNLFNDNILPLEKVPYKFSCSYYCHEPGCKGHNQSIIDWEIFQLYRKELRSHGTEREAIESVHTKYMQDIFSSKTDVHFFVGTVLEHASWLIIGVYYPKKKNQLSLPF